MAARVPTWRAKNDYDQVYSSVIFDLKNCWAHKVSIQLERMKTNPPKPVYHMNYDLATLKIWLVAKRVVAYSK